MPLKYACIFVLKKSRLLKVKFLQKSLQSGDNWRVFPYEAFGRIFFLIVLSSF